MRIVASCRLCAGAAYQSPPVFLAGSSNPKVLVIGQNPGEIKPDDVDRLWWADKMADAYSKSPSLDGAGVLLKNWYDWDFGTSGGAKRMGQVFGDSWVENGDFAFTNAVRCRTPGNKAPTAEMVDNCTTYTRKLMFNFHLKAIVMMGQVAVGQVLGADAHKLSWATPRRHPKLGIIMSIKHYASWHGEDLKDSREAWARVAKEIGVEAR
jgi:uracil-DNA glycosylase